MACRLLLPIALTLACAASALGCGDSATTGARPPHTPSGLDARTTSDHPDARNMAPGAVMTGLASYYADSLTGRPTASGEPYDPKQLTAAHRTLPFGTLVEVTRQDGRTVTVRINDRGPFGSKKRILDLSRRAAEQVGLIRAGVAPVTARVLGRTSAR